MKLVRRKLLPKDFGFLYVSFSFMVLVSVGMLIVAIALLIIADYTLTEEVTQGFLTAVAVWAFITFVGSRPVIESVVNEVTPLGEGGGYIYAEPNSMWGYAMWGYVVVRGGRVEDGTLYYVSAGGKVYRFTSSSIEEIQKFADEAANNPEATSLSGILAPEERLAEFILNQVGWKNPSPQASATHP